MVKKKTQRVRKTSTKNWGQVGTKVPMPATVIVPSGRCPFIIDEYSEEAVYEWVVALTKWKADVITYKQSVYTYWLRHSFEMTSKEFQKAVNIVKQIVPENTKNLHDLHINKSELEQYM